MQPDLSSSRDAAAAVLLAETFSRRRVRALYREHGGPVAAWQAVAGEGWERRVEALRAACGQRGIGLTCEWDRYFPEALSRIPDAPVALYWRGALAAAARPSVAIVGARRASRYGLELAESLASELAARGIGVVSGLALGIDSAAHRGALAGRGRTVAVLGSGLARVQPHSNLRLATRLLEAGGLMISEYAPELPGSRYRFPERNRLISGLADGVIVIEASARSGSLITAGFATEQGREVMAVPGAPGLANSVGGNRLLKEGAALVESADDVLDALGLPERPASVAGAAQPPRLSAALVAVLDELKEEAVTADVLAGVLGLGVAEITVRLTELELNGFVARVADGYIRRPLRF